MTDDRVFRATRMLGAVIVPFLLVAFALLYFFPDDTRHWFAWDVQPTITPLIMGAGYIAGAYFFVRVARETRWHRIQVGFLPVTAFTLFMAIGTFNHLDRFATAHVAFWIWVGLYVVDAGAGAAGVVAQPGDRPAHAGARRAAAAALRAPAAARGRRRAVAGGARAAALALDDDRALAVAADAADGADARRLVRAAGRDRADDGARRPLERDPDHAREPADRARADPARHRARLGGRRHLQRAGLRVRRRHRGAVRRAARARGLHAAPAAPAAGSRSAVQSVSSATVAGTTAPCSGG